MSLAIENDIRWVRSRPKNIPDEKVFYEAGNVRITNLIATFGEDSYSIWLITSAGKRKIIPRNWLPLFLITFAALLTGEGLDDVVEGAPDQGVKWAFLILGIFIAGYSLYLNERTKPYYKVQLDSPLGQIHAYTSESEEEVTRIVNAIRQAIAEKE
jgi:hypothetical protein